MASMALTFVCQPPIKTQADSVPIKLAISLAKSTWSVCWPTIGDEDSDVPKVSMAFLLQKSKFNEDRQNEGRARIKSFDQNIGTAE